MNTKLRRLIPLLFALLPAALVADGTSKNCGCSCCKGKEICCCHAKDADSAKAQAETPCHPLKGVIVEVQSTASALLVKHEDIPGFMPAMTMLFRVDAATLAAVKPGDVITARLVPRAGEFRLEDVKISR
jgi:Cu/Ag efflux protein CusF